MKILLIVDDYLRSDVSGGGDISAQNIYWGFKNRGHDVSVLCTTQRKGCSKDSNNENIYRILTAHNTWKKLSLPCLFMRLLIDRIRIRIVCCHIKPDIIYCLHPSGIALPTIAYINKVSCPKIYRIGYEWLRLHYYADKCKWFQFWQKRSNMRNYINKHLLSGLGKLVDCNRPELSIRYAIFNSEDLLDRHQNYMHEGSTKKVIRNGIDTTLFKHCIHITHDEPKILFVGRIVPHKGLHILISSLAILRSQLKTRTVRLTIVGSSSNTNYKQQLLKLAHEKNVEETIEWMGNVEHDNIPNILATHDIFVFPSIKRDEKRTVEGCPSSLLEALSVGIPVIARISSGVDEIDINDECVLGYHSDNPEELAACLIRLITDRLLYEKLAREGPKLIVKHFALDNMIRETELAMMDCIEHWEPVYGNQ